MTQPGTQAASSFGMVVVWVESVDLVGFQVRSVGVTGPWVELGIELHVVVHSQLAILVEMVVQP